MGYTSGAKILADIIEEIANGLIATAGGYWTNADTTWTTAVKTLNNARRALKYLNGTEVMYLTLEAINTNYTLQSNWIAKGIRVGFSPDWDAVGHVPTSTTYRSTIPFEARSTTVDADLAILQITYYLWIDANGFVITAKPEPIALDGGQSSFVLLVERNPNKEYTDGFSNFFALCECNYTTWLGNGDANYYYRKQMRPFTYQANGWDAYANLIFPQLGISYPAVYDNWAGYLFAFKSNGNGKVYYVKPVVANTADNLTPIAQLELFFRYVEGAGLVDGDVIAIEGQTTKYLCKALDSPDAVTRLPIAMKYVA